MLRVRNVSLSVIASLAILARVTTAATSTSPIAGVAEIGFEASSTLHDFNGSCPPVSFGLEPGPTGGWSASVDVAVATLETGNTRRDDGMRAMLRDAAFPQIHARFQDIDPEAVRGRGTLPFVLTIGPVSQPIEAEVKNWTQPSDHELRFEATFGVSLARFDLVAPRVLFIGVDDRVRVNVRVTLTRPPSTPGFDSSSAEGETRRDGRLDLALTRSHAPYRRWSLESQRLGKSDSCPH